MPHADVRPPLARGDLYQARDEGGGLLLVIDGVFAHRYAAAPSEVVDVARDGATVVGAASMGAVRAAECWPAGVEGVGSVYWLYRLGVLRSDDEVAVATDPESDFVAVSVALVNVRYALLEALRAGALDRKAAHRVLSAAQTLDFPDRTWRRISRNARVEESLLARLESVDIKRRDALRALERVAVLDRCSGSSSDPRAGRTRRRPPRYPGHDPWLGHEPQRVRAELARWLLGSGRYRRYVWAIVAGSLPVPREIAPDRLPLELRAALAHHVVREIEEDFDGVADRLWHELAFIDEAKPELMRWHALTTLAAGATISAGFADGVRLAREEIAIEHGYRDWPQLVRARPHAVPTQLIDGAAELLARARCHPLVVRGRSRPWDR